MNEIGFGTAPLAFRDVPVDQAVATIHAALDHGVRLIDTALAYTRPGVESYAESVVARAVAGRDGVVVATKGGHYRAGDEFPIDARPAALRAHCEVSLRTLGVERIDLYQLHHVDPHVPLAESVGALRDLRDEGRIARIGLSNVDIQQIEVARAVAPIAAVQNRLSYSTRGDLPVAEHCRRLGITYLAYMPLHGPDDAALTAVAGRHGVSTQQVRVAWLLDRAPGVVPLVGSSRRSSIVDSLAALTLQLTPDDVSRLDGG